MAGFDLLLAGVLFLFAAVIAVPLASRLGIGAVLGYLLAEGLADSAGAGGTETPEEENRIGFDSAEQALTAVTLNGAAAICRADRIGSIEPGKQADLLIWKAENLDYICYRLGSNLVDTVIKKGNVV